MEWFWGELLLEVRWSSEEKMAMIISASSGVCSTILGAAILLATYPVSVGPISHSTSNLLLQFVLLILRLNDMIHLLLTLRDSMPMPKITVIRCLLIYHLLNWLLGGRYSLCRKWGVLHVVREPPVIPTNSSSHLHPYSLEGASAETDRQMW